MDTAARPSSSGPERRAGALLPNLVVCGVGAALLAVGVLDDRRSDEVASALLVLGAGLVVVGVVLSRLVELELGAEGVKLRLRARDDGDEPTPGDERGPERPRRRWVTVLATAALLAVGLLVSGAAARSALVPNYRVPAVDPRAQPCTWTLRASLADGVGSARIPDVVGAGPEAATRALRGAGLRVRRTGTVSGQCVTANQSRRAGTRLTSGEHLIVRLAEKPATAPSPAPRPAQAPQPAADHDADGDGFNAAQFGGTDCNDQDRAIHPRATETPGDGIDQDCDGQDATADADGDTFAATAAGGTDCDDTDAAIHPGAVDVPGDGIDQDCDGQDATADADGDTFAATAAGGTDCDDTDAAIHPGALDVPGDGIDQDCDGQDAAATGP